MSAIAAPDITSSSSPIRRERQRKPPNIEVTSPTPVVDPGNRRNINYLKKIKEKDV